MNTSRASVPELIEALTFGVPFEPKSDGTLNLNGEGLNA
jgi:hypothetical protein